MKTPCKVLICFLLSVAVSNAYAQGQTENLNGTVVDNQNMPIIGAFIVIKGYENGTVTDVNGVFSLKIEKGKNLTLIISSIGYVKKNVVINAGQTTDIRIQLDDEVKELE